VNTPATIAAILVQFPETEIASTLAEMRASGEHDDAVARGIAMRDGEGAARPFAT
jgi:hypothetical protein